MEIVWLGHSCFRLKGSDLTVVTAPYDDSLGYGPGTLHADVVTVSHQSPHHSYVERVEGASKKSSGAPASTRSLTSSSWASRPSAMTSAGPNGGSTPSTA